jgi:hypothetical protein
MASDLDTNSDISLLHPRMQAKVLEVLKISKEKGLNLGVYETVRSLKRQKLLVKRHYSETIYSYHVLGLATDFVFKDKDGRWTWKVPKSKWEELAKILESVGLVAGWHWESLEDGPHGELKLHGISSKALHEKLNKLGSREAFYKWLDENYFKSEKP